MDKTNEFTNISLADIGNSLSAASVIFLNMTLKLKHRRELDTESTDTDFSAVLEFADEIFTEFNSPRSRGAVFSCGPCICKASHYDNEGYYIAMASDDEAALDVLKNRFIEILPPIEATEDKIPLSFWTLQPNGHASCRSRRIIVPSWKEIEANYPGGVGDSLNELMTFTPGRSGQLILLHGCPGTGKSYAIRALLKEWSHWCKADYIVDPERFFGENAEYMVSVLLTGDHSDEPDVTVGSGVVPTSPWRLYIVEDGDEFLTEDAKTRSGQALSRLLNVVDGMIGQGLQVLVLVTTNEPLGNLHPAVIRPGRCIANVEFKKFSQEESRQWLNGNSSKTNNVVGEKTLAELYYELGEIESVGYELEKGEKLGFKS
jgi:hypothetical protein